MKKLKKVFNLLLISSLIIAILFFPKDALYYALTGLNLWFQKMIPTLLPFMILSGILIKLNLNTYFVRFLSPILSPLYRIGKQGVYVMFIGYLCGFPMGAKTCTQLYNAKKISKNEAEYLLSFCNNIGPVYFLTFVLLSMQITNKIPYIMGMYGIPLLYGLVLRYTTYRNSSFITEEKNAATTMMTKTDKKVTLFDAVDESIYSSLRQIAMLGGYMVLFNLGVLIPTILFAGKSFLVAAMNCLFEITSGITSVLTFLPNNNFVEFIIFTSLIFGGFSCMAQTMSILKETDLSMKKYIIHKLILTVICGFYYFFLLLR